MTEYDRETNVNTAEYWDSAWRRSPDAGETKNPVRTRIMEQLSAIPGDATVYEYGFGSLHFAKMLGAGRWRGRDVSAVAVERARADGFHAHVGTCGASEGFRKSFLVAIEVLEHLSADELRDFLTKSRNAPHAWFSVPIQTARDEAFHQHQRGFGRPDDFQRYLQEFWPHVEVEAIGHWMLAHCSTKAPPKQPTLTIGCSTLMDFWGSNYTLMSLYSQNQHLVDDGTIELVLVDNHPDPGDDPNDKEAIEIMRKVATDCGARYVQWCEKQGTYPGKNQLQVEARGKWVLTIDSHVFLSNGTVDTVLDLIRDRPESDDFYHLPCLHKPGVMVDFRYLHPIYVGLEKAKKDGSRTYGYTGEMRKAGEPYPIAAQITSAYLVRRAAWFSGKGYDPILGMYGGWEGPLQVKWRLMGREVLSIRHREPKPVQAYHWHHFNTRVFSKVFKWAVDGMESKGKKVRYHTGATKMRNYCASSAVTGGEKWVRRHCELRGWNFNSPFVQEGMRAGLKLRPWMVEHLARPEWEDIGVFFAWMKDAGIPGALERW